MTFLVSKIFAYLAIEARQRPVARAYLIDLLWPGYAPKSGQANLRTTLYRLRQLCLPYEIIKSNHKEIQLCPQPGEFWCDWETVTNGSPPIEPQGRHPELMEGFHLPDCPAFMGWLDEQRGLLRQRLAQAAREREPSPLHAGVGPIPEHRPPVGRETQLAQLHTWLVAQPGRLVGIFGMGGQGKTTLAATFARSLEEGDFELILWSTLVNAQPWTALFSEWVHTLTHAPRCGCPTTWKANWPCSWAWPANAGCSLCWTIWRRFWKRA